MHYTHTLELTCYMAPHKVIPWYDAISRAYVGKIDIIEEYDEEVCSPSLIMRIPAVVRLKKPISAFKKGVKFSKVNVFTRDRNTCMYCGNKFPARALTYDHVVPRVQGGKTTWQNVTSCCRPCNARKGGRTPAQAGMHLLKQPIMPKVLPLAVPTLPQGVYPELWRPYLEAAGGSGLYIPDATIVAVG